MNNLKKSKKKKVIELTRDELALWDRLYFTVISAGFGGKYASKVSDKFIRRRRIRFKQETSSTPFRGDL